MAEKFGLIPVKDEVEQIAGYYHNFAIKIRQALFRLNPANYSEMNAMALRDDIDKLIYRANLFTYAWAKKSVSKGYDLAEKKTAGILNRMGKEKSQFIKVMYGRIDHNGTVQRYIDQTTQDLIDKNGDTKLAVELYIRYVKQASEKLPAQIQEFVSEEFESELDNIFIEGAKVVPRTTKAGDVYMAAKSRGELLREIKNLFLDNFGKTDFIEIVCKDGVTRHYQFGKYADLVARTRLRQSQTAAVKNTCAEYDQDLVEWSTHSNPCEICEQYEGRIFSLSGQDPRYPPLEEEPPIHPNCEHNIYPVSEAELLMRTM
jgi:hypothetical protein